MKNLMRMGVFKEKFEGLVNFAQETYEIGYEMLWQGDAND